MIGTVQARGVLLAAVAALTAILGAPGLAQTPASEPTRAQIEAEYDAAFQEVLRDPANLDKSFKFADLAVKVGDYEGAISALERMLILNPSLRRVRLELGVLYFRLGSYGIARTYLEGAIEGPDVPPLVRERVASFLGEIDKRLASDRLTGSLTIGGRYQTNANSGPGSTSVRVFGFPADLDNRFTSQDDYNVFASLNLRHLYDLGTQTRDALESEFVAFGSKQIEQDQVDVGFLEASTGPRYALLPGMLEAATIRPYLLLTYVSLGDSRLFSSWGGGANLTKQFSDRIGGALNYQFRDKKYRPNGGRPNAGNNDGFEHEAYVDGQYALTASTALNARARLTAMNADAEFESNLEHAFLAGVSHTYDAPFSLTSSRWLTGFSVELVRTVYDSPDPVVDPGVRRRDERWNLRFVTVVPLDASFSASFSAGYTDVDSSLPNYRFDNKYGGVAMTYNF